MLPHLLALETQGEALAYLGHITRAREVHEQLLRLAATGGPLVRRAESSALMQGVLCLVLEGRCTEAVAVVSGVREQTIGDPDPYVRALVSMVLGATQIQSGWPVTARRSLLDALSGFDRSDLAGSRSWILSMLAQCEALVGDLAAARLSFQRAREVRPSHPVARNEADLVLAEVAIFTAAGDPDRAARIAIEGAARLGELRIYRARLLHRGGTLTTPTKQCVDELEAIAQDVEGDLPAAFAAHVRGLRDQDAAVLEEVATGFEDRGQWLHAAEAAAQASRCHWRAGDRSAAQRMSIRSAALGAHCEGARTPALTVEVSAPQLPRREAQVAQLAAQGLPNAAIAERLVLSVRTVESHLYQVFAKLGMDRRDQLSRHLPENPVVDH